MKSYVQTMLSKALDTLVSSGVLQSVPTDESIQVERTRDPAHGDFASNCAMVCARLPACGHVTWPSKL